MLSVACHESLPPPPAEPAPAGFSFRRLVVTLEKDDRRGQKARHQRPSFPPVPAKVVLWSLVSTAVPAMKVPIYSRIVFRAGMTSVR